MSKNNMPPPLEESSVMAASSPRSVWARLLSRGYYLKGLFPFLYMVLNLSFWLGPLLLLSLLKLLIPWPLLRRGCYAGMTWIYRAAVSIDDFLLWRLYRMPLTVSGVEHLRPEQTYLVFANHQSWTDILILQSLFNRRAPLLKFIVKQQILYLPLVGLICWAYEYPFLKRHSPQYLHQHPEKQGEDLQILQKACEKFQATPATILNFLEGTRYTPRKQQQQNSPYRHLLNPKAGGVALILRAMSAQLSEILDVTIVYDPPRLSFWDFLSGRCRHIQVQVTPVSCPRELHTSSSLDPEQHYEKTKEWLQQVWAAKDLVMRQIQLDRQERAEDSGR